jgi:predicted acetyltransferase
VDVKKALSARSYASGKSVVLEVRDEFCEWNNGTWRIGADGIERTTASADIRCNISVLGSAYLGGFTWARLSEALRLEELRPGAAEHADAVFRSRSAPWCPEIF